MIALLSQEFDLTSPVQTFELVQGSNNRAVGIHTADGDFVWKIYTAHTGPDSIRYEHDLLGWLAAQGLPFAVPRPVPTGRGETWITTADGLGVLCSFLPGTLPDYAKLDHMQAAGIALAQLHRTLARMPLRQRPGMAAYGELEQIHPLAPSPDTLTPAILGLPESSENRVLFDWWRGLMVRTKAFVDGPYRQLPWQVVHGDFTPRNALFIGNQVSAIIDFEFTCPDARVIDVAAGLHFSMRRWDRDDPWPFGRAFVQGYLSQNPLTQAEIAAIPDLMRLRETASSIHWLGRALAEGNVASRLEHLQDFREYDPWLTENGEGLRGLFEKN